jgi:hypothetical protein
MKATSQTEIPTLWDTFTDTVLTSNDIESLMEIESTIESRGFSAIYGDYTLYAVSVSIQSTSRALPAPATFPTQQLLRRNQRNHRPTPQPVREADTTTLTSPCGDLRFRNASTVIARRSQKWGPDRRFATLLPRSPRRDLNITYTALAGRIEDYSCNLHLQSSSDDP